MDFLIQINVIRMGGTIINFRGLHHVWIQRGDRGSGPPEKSQKYMVSWQYWSRSPENLKATKSAFNVRLSSARWRFAGGPMMASL